MGIWSHRRKTYFILWKRLNENVLYFFKKHKINIIDFEMKKTLPLPKEELKSHKDGKFCYIWGKRT